MNHDDLKVWADFWVSTQGKPIDFAMRVAAHAVANSQQTSCPYKQGDETHWCLLAEKGQPLTNEAIQFKFSTMGEAFTPLELEAFRAGVRFAETSHGITG